MIRKKEPKRQPKSHNRKLHDARIWALTGLAREDFVEISRSRRQERSLHSDRHVDKWVAAQLLCPQLTVRTISLHDLKGWSIDPVTGNIGHDSGRFFSLTGTYVRHRTFFGEMEWDQPYIDQPEVGILGIMTKRINGVLHFCLQAKEEPGNINSVQLSPTVQATYSNYTRVHGGNSPRFLEYFRDSSRSRLIYAKLQTEDGGRFLYKSNRNMIVQVDDPELDALPEGFIWLTLKQIVRLLSRDNLVHACTRSILAALLLPEASDDALPSRNMKAGAGGGPVSGAIGSIMQWLDDQKAGNHIFIKRMALGGLKEWSLDRDGSFSHEAGRFFRVIGIDVESGDREVSSWNQPILDNPGTGVIGLLTRVHKGERFYLMQAKAEPGNRSIVQIGPTVQFTPGNYIGNAKLAKPFLFEEFYRNEQFPLVIESMQSEEGARFFREAHLHRILSLPEGEELELPPEFCWISQTDLHFFMQMGEMVNSCARSVLALML